jgi:anti-sigma B factor antagonist
MLKVGVQKNRYWISIIKTTRINSLVAEGMKDQLLELVSQKKKEVILSLRGIKFIDNTGFETILSVVKTAREHHCSFRICDVSQEVYELFRLMKLNVVFEIHPEKVEVLS